MSVQNYGLLRGSVIDVMPYQNTNDHYQAEISASGQLYRLAIDVYSKVAGTKLAYSPNGLAVLDVDRLVMFYKDENYTHPILTDLLKMKEGLTLSAQLPQSLRLDYLRTAPALFPIDQMKTIPPKDENGNGEDLNDDINPWMQKAKNNSQVEVFAFGSSWNDNDKDAHPDTRVFFHATDPQTLGIHDIHMNQGDSGSEARSNGTGQDGALFIRLVGGTEKAAGAGGGADGGQEGGTSADAAGAVGADATEGADTWVAMFFRFQNQRIKTDSKGNPA